MVPTSSPTPSTNPQITLSATTWRLVLRDALGCAAQTLLDSTPPRLLPRPEWADAEGCWMLEVQYASTDRALVYLQYLAGQRMIQPARALRSLLAVWREIDTRVAAAVPLPGTPVPIKILP